MVNNNSETFKMIPIMQLKTIAGSDVNILLSNSQKNGLCHLLFSCEFNVLLLKLLLCSFVLSSLTFNFSSLFSLALALNHYHALIRSVNVEEHNNFIFEHLSISGKLNILITKMNCICFNIWPLNYSWHFKFSKIGGN